MKKTFITIIFALIMSLNLISCVSMNLTTQIIDIDENPDSEIVVNAMWLKEPIKVKSVLEKATVSNGTYKAEKRQTLQIFTINPKDKIRFRFNAKKWTDKLFMDETDFTSVGLRFSPGNWGCVSGFNWFKGKSRVIVLTKDGKMYSLENKTYKDTK